MNKEQIIKKMKSGSLLIGILCALVTVFNGAMAVYYFIERAVYFGRSSNGSDIYIETSAMSEEASYIYLKNGMTFIFAMIIMLVATIMFFHISRTGVPFSSRNRKMIIIIGALYIANAIIPGLIASLLTHVAADGLYMGQFSPIALIEGLLFIFIAYIVKYGAMLQQESDETL